ncbi:flavin reductase family protein [Streptomyces caniscabiei]|uniref:flavin reductase family protein n=1 Tax=Streptomyces caniscabiei TaxID=2746961 RepID=UPI0023501482|nr:flavin reductase family protein [Streptomyces caniscabiei]
MTTSIRTTTGPIGPAEFRNAMALLVAPITVVTTLDATGRRWGFTASAVTSVSMEPPLMLVGIGRESSCHPALTSADEFAVNLLGEEHQATARAFATRDSDRFAASGGFEQWPGAAIPYLPAATAAFRCRRTDVVPAGDHDLVLGELVEIHTGESTAPLLWYRRDFHTPERSRT